MNLPTKLSLLLVDDEASIVSSLTHLLEAKGCNVVGVTNARDALTAVSEKAFDIMITDLRMPIVQGFELIDEVRRFRPSIGIIIYSATLELPDLIQSIRAHVDDFVSKESGLESILEAISRTIVRRSRELQLIPTLGQLTVGPLHINDAEKRIIWHGKPLILTPTEYCLLRTLALRANQLVPAEELVRVCRGYALKSSEANTLIKPHMSHLRHKLEEDGYPRAIENRRSEGFMLIVDHQGEAAHH